MAEIARDDDTVARLISSPIPPFLSLTSALSIAPHSELGLIESPISPHVERGRTIEPLSLFALTGHSGGGMGARSMSRSISGSGYPEPSGGPRILDIVTELLNARDGDVRESACLWYVHCLSTKLMHVNPPE